MKKLGLLVLIFLTISISAYSQFTISFSHNVTPSQNNYLVNSKVDFAVTTSDSNLSNYYHWDFGGPVSGFMKSSFFGQATYVNPGTYYPCLTLVNSNSDTASYCDTVIVPAVAKFLHNSSLLTTTFTDRSWMNPGGVYNWNFGDGSSGSSANNPMHTYSNPGAYQVCLTITDTVTNDVDIFCDSVFVDSTNFIYYTYSVDRNKVYLNDSTNMTNPSLFWYYGGSAGYTAYSNYVEYQSPWKYQICVTAVDSSSSSPTISYCDSVLVPPVADFNVFSKYGLSVTLQNKGFFSNGYWSQTEWDFGDGFDTITNGSASHTYNSPGTYYVCQTITDTFLNVVSTYCDSITVDSIPPISVSYTYTVNHNQVNFNVTSLGNPVSSYSWNYGGWSNSGTYNSVNYNLPGSYYACLTVNDSNMNSATYCDTVDVPCSALFVDSTFGMTASFTNVSFRNSPASYVWDFGDSSSSTNTNASHTYASEGTYTVCLTVTDSNCTDTYCKTIVIDTSANSCNPSFTHTENGLISNFVNTSINSGTNNYYRWNYGDGTASGFYTFSTGPNHHTYYTPGVFDLCLSQIKYDSSFTSVVCSTTVCDTVRVDTLPPLPNTCSGFTFTTSVNRGHVYFLPSYAGTISSRWYDYDGPVSYSSQSSAKYSHPDTYYPCMTINDSVNNCTATYCDSVVVPCEALFIDSTLSSMTVAFSNFSYPSNGTFSWDFGDSSAISNATNPTHTYSAPGWYNVCLTVNNGFCIDTYCDSVYVDSSLTSPAIGVSYTYNVVNTNEVVFQVNTWGNPVATYNWNYGGWVSSSSYDSATYVNPGIYVACITVYDSNSNWATYCDTIVVPCQANFVDTTNGFVASFSNTSFKNFPVTYLWDFGDSNTSNLANPTHTYSTTGVFNVCLTITDSNCTSTFCDSVVIDTVNTLSLSYTPSINGNVVYFTLNSSTIITSQSWNYGGPTISAGWGYVKYSFPGTYIVCVNATDTFNKSGSYCDTVTVPCFAKFNHVDSLLTSNFTNKSFVNPSATYSWDFGDSTVSSMISPTHTYSAPGVYLVCLTVYDSITNCTDTYCDTVYAYASYNCNANFLASVISPGIVMIYDSSSSNLPYTRKVWDFGDGNSLNYSTSNFTHRYLYDGSYQICLTVSDTNGICSSTYCDSVVISGAPVPKWNITGYAFTDTTSWNDSVIVYLIREDTNFSSPYLVLEDSSMNRSFHFYVEEGIYYLKAAMADTSSSNYNSYVPTYYGQEQLWTNASTINLFGSNQYSKNIQLLSGTNPGGPGFIGGYVSLGANLVAGDPIKGVQMLLLDDVQQPVAHQKTNVDGEFAFSNLQLGTYEVYADILNIPAAPTIITLTSENPTAEEIAIVVNSDTVGQAPTGIEYQANENKEEFILYPNPTSDIVHLESSRELDKDQIEIFNSIGNLLNSEDLIDMKTEKRFVIKLDNLQSGLYFIKLTTSEGEITKRIVKR